MNAGQTPGDLVCGHPSIRGVDAKQVRSGGRVAAIDQLLERLEVAR